MSKRSIGSIFFLLALVSVLVLAEPPESEAAGCQSYSQYSYSYPAYNYSQSYSYAPSYLPAYNYSYPVKYVEYEVVKPYPVRTVLSPDFYFSSSDSYRDQAQAQRDQLLTDAAAFRAVQAILGLRDGGAGKMAPAAGLRAGNYVPAPGEKRSTVPVTSALTAGGVPDGLQAVVDAKCLRCHSGSDPKRLNLSSLATVQRVDRLDSWGRVNKGSMPKGGQALPDTEENLFYAWSQAR